MSSNAVGQLLFAAKNAQALVGLVTVMVVNSGNPDPGPTPLTIRHEGWPAAVAGPAAVAAPAIAVMAAAASTADLTMRISPPRVRGSDPRTPLWQQRL